MNFLSHLLLPRESNNHRARILHHSSLLTVLSFLFLLGSIIVAVRSHAPSVLGTSTDISSQQLLLITNQYRQQNNLPPLALNQELTNAAAGKAEDMFIHNYWAHFCPCGTSPWDFIHGAGYNYVYAGENLARGFTSAQSVVDAWMNSPEHRDNQLSPHYTDVGYAVEDGSLLGEQTTLVVEEFGSQTAPEPVANGSSNAQVAQQATQPTKAVEQVAAGKQPLIQPTAIPQQVSPIVDTTSVLSQGQPQAVAGLHSQSLFNSLLVTKSIGVVLAILFVITLIADAIIIERKKVVRIIGHHIDHTFFFAMILFLLLFIIGRGIIV